MASFETAASAEASRVSRPPVAEMPEETLLVAKTVEDHPEEETEDRLRRFHPGAQLLVDDEGELRILERHRRRQSSGAVEGGHLPEHLPRSEDREHLPFVAEVGRDFDATRLDDERLARLVALAEDDLPRTEAPANGDLFQRGLGH